MRTFLLKRGGRPKCMIQLSRAPIRNDDVGVLQRVAARGADRQRMVVGHHALAHRRGQERHLGALDELADLVLGARVGHALADDDERPLRRAEHVQRALDVLRHGLGARRVRAARRLLHARLVDLAGDDVVRHVEIARAGPAVDRVPDRHLDVERDAVHVLDRVRELAERRGDQHLPLFLERAHAVAPGLRRAADAGSSARRSAARWRGRRGRGPRRGPTRRGRRRGARSDSRRPARHTRRTARCACRRR